MKKAYVKPVVRSHSIQPGDIEAGSRFAQKRSVPRYPFAEQVTIVDPIARHESAGRTSDISSRGCFVELIDQFPRNSIVQISIERTDESFKTWGRVAHVHEALGTGIGFLDTDADQKLILEKWIAEAAKVIEVGS